MSRSFFDATEMTIELLAKETEHGVLGALAVASAAVAVLEQASLKAELARSDIDEFKRLVQKGAFRRVRTINAKAGKQAVDKALTTLPQKGVIGVEVRRADASTLTLVKGETGV